MKLKDTKILNSYPGYVNNERMEAVEETLKLFRESLKEYAAENNLPLEQIRQIEEYLEKIYILRKASLHFESKTGSFLNYLSEAANIMARNSDNCTRMFRNSEMTEESKFFYYNNKNHLITNEQY